MNETIVLIIITAILIPAIPVLIVSVYVTQRNSKHIGVIFERVDELKEKKANAVDIKELQREFHKTELKYSEFFGRFTSALDRLELIEQKFEQKLNKE